MKASRFLSAFLEGTYQSALYQALAMSSDNYKALAISERS